MFQVLAPTWFVDSIYDLDLDKLWQRGIRGIVTDLDNTLIEWNVPEPDERLLEWAKRVRERGFKVCIASNNGRPRVEAFAKHLDVPFLYKAGKPRRHGLRAALELMGTTPGTTALLGDQIFTDILGGNRLGLMTILVRPIAKREFIGTRLVRRVERRVLAILRHRGLLSKP